MKKNKNKPKKTRADERTKHLSVFKQFHLKFKQICLLIGVMLPGKYIYIYMLLLLLLKWRCLNLIFVCVNMFHFIFFCDYTLYQFSQRVNFFPWVFQKILLQCVEWYAQMCCIYIAPLLDEYQFRRLIQRKNEKKHWNRYRWCVKRCLAT